jgi:hypothetical protein
LTGSGHSDSLSGVIIGVVIIFTLIIAVVEGSVDEVTLEHEGF